MTNNIKSKADFTVREMYFSFPIFQKARTALAETGFSHIFYFPICMRLNYSCDELKMENVTQQIKK